MAPVEVIDTHVHIWQRRRFDYHWIQPGSYLDRDFLLADSRADMDARGVTGGILVEASNCAEETEWLLRAASADDRLWGVVGWLDLDDPDMPERMASLARMPLWKGFRINWLESRLDDQPLEHAVRAMIQHDRVVEILMQSEYSPQVAAFVRRHPHIRFVINHCGGLRSDEAISPQIEVILQEFAPLDHVVLKLSAFHEQATLREIVAAFVGGFGRHRLMFGSNWPLCLNAGAYGKTIDRLLDATASLGSAVQRALFSETARHCYRLP